ncbi:ribosome small subunit-dependent GTPase A [Abyssibius alkaniclasticus]|uniref:ribosome small subunit-dependent GTPase A n=1 Tax=Abyssibius alkaniclasticus TaxID=2881234 RepID=UPI00405A1F61
MTYSTLADLGWSAHFARQLDDDSTGTPARLCEIHRDRVEALSPAGPLTLRSPDSMGAYAVGDWVLARDGLVLSRLERLTTVSRRAAGEAAQQQLIAANVDTLGIVTSCNDDFNVARLERYLALAAMGGSLPLIILTKADLTDEPDDFRRQAEALSPMVSAIALNVHDAAAVDQLTPWCKAGQTLALVGSSGVGKTTLQNALTGIIDATQDIRSDDGKGRHTTTARALRPTLAGGWLIDTPGMRELRLTDAAEGIDAVFDDIVSLITRCKFNDCAHEAEPGCAVQAAIAAGALDAGRLKRWRKLKNEDRYSTESVHDARARFRKLGKMYKAHKKPR